MSEFQPTIYKHGFKIKLIYMSPACNIILNFKLHLFSEGPEISPCAMSLGLVCLYSAFFHKWFKTIYIYNKMIMQYKQGKEAELEKKYKWKQKSKPGMRQGRVANAHI